MLLADLLYKIEGEVEDGPSPDVVIVTDEGKTYAPEAVSSDGRVVVINARRTTLHLSEG